MKCNSYCGHQVRQLTCPAVFAHPAVQAHLSPRGLAAIVAEVVVTGNAQLVALAAVVVLVAAHSDAVGEAGHGAVVQDGLPGVAGVDHAGVDAAFNQQLLLVWNTKQTKTNQSVGLEYSATISAQKHEDEYLK